MTNPTPQDREMAEKLAQLLVEYEPACDCDDCNYIRTHDLLTIQKAITTARLQGRREGLEEAARVAETTYAKDAFRFELNTATAAAIRTLYGAEPDKDGEG